MSAKRVKRRGRDTTVKTKEWRKNEKKNNHMNVERNFSLPMYNQQQQLNAMRWRKRKREEQQENKRISLNPIKEMAFPSNVFSDLFFYFGYFLNPII